MLPFTTSAYAFNKGLPKPFKLKEFKGKWVLTAESAGGVGSNDGPGYSSAILRIIDFDKIGEGKSFFSTVLILRPDGSLDVLDQDNELEVFKLKIVDRANGAGTITVLSSGGKEGVNVLYKFIALRNKNGRVNEIDVLLAQTAGVPIVFKGKLRRQQPQ